VTANQGVNREMEAPAVPVVHAVTSDEIIARADFIDVACAVMAALGPRGALHLRASKASGARLAALAETLTAAQMVTGAWLVVNDRVDIALVSGARGAQLTSRSLRVSDARISAPSLALGASVHSLAEGHEATQSGAQWIVGGRVQAPGGRSSEAASGIEFLSELATATTVPIVAIGGVRPAHCAELRSHGVHGVAVIRGIWDAPNAERAASDYLSCYDDAGDA
jgi:thiamine-phosphate diphosphorylase